jgi:hypothetical protein
LLGLSQNLKISNNQPFLSSQKFPSFARRGWGQGKRIKKKCFVRDFANLYANSSLLLASAHFGSAQ